VQTSPADSPCARLSYATYVESPPTEAVDDSSRARPIVGDAVKVHERAPTSRGRIASPSLQIKAFTAERRAVTRGR
jgi:hypothetical protein